MGGSIFGSSSDSKSRATDKSVTASDQAIVYQPTKSGNLKNVGNFTNTVSKNSTQIINNGITSDSFEDGLSKFADELLVNANTNPTTTSGDGGFNASLLDALTNRSNANTERAIDEVKAGSPSTVSNYFLWGIGAIFVIGLVFALVKRRT